jgi:hypothetical protein
MINKKEFTNIIVPVILFILLSPGFIITLPSTEKGFYMSRETSIQSIFFHALVFSLIYFLLRKFFADYY